jgi:coenzyme F420-reducing hydrogenase delta subunit
VAPLGGTDVVALDLVCIGQLPPSFIEYALRAGAAGVVVTGCREGDCAFRLGQRWTEERLLGMREPRLRAGVPREALRVVWPGPGEPMAVARALDDLRRQCGAAASRAEAGCHA